MPDAPHVLAYDARVDSQTLKDDAKVSVTEDGLTVTTLFAPLFIAFSDVVWFAHDSYSVTLTTSYDRFTFTRLGSLVDGLYLELDAAFNAQVTKALFIAGDPGFQGVGEFRYAEAGQQAAGQAAIRVYDDCVGLFPPDDRARRIPFAFMNGLQEAGFELTLTLDGGDAYSFARLGRDTDAFAACVKDRLHQYRENAIAAVRSLDGSLNPAALAAIATRMPQGVAVSVGDLSSIAPSYVAALEAEIAKSRAADTYTALKTICTPSDICVGMKTGLGGEDKDNILWFIAPSATKPVAAVELALAEEDAAATFVYTMTGDRADFVRRLNRAMEAVAFHREVISMPDDELRQAQNSGYAMAVRRTAALRFMRDNLLGRVIHTSLDSWTAGVKGYLT